MSKRILVLYSSREGHTRTIVDTMLAHAPHWQADLRDLHAGPVLDLAPYDRVLVAASIRYGRFHRSLDQFAARHWRALQDKPNAFVAVNLVARKPEKSTPQTNAYTRKWLKRSAWQPQHVAVFAGALCYSRYTWWEKRIIQAIMWITGGSTDTGQDIAFTNWADVQTFSEQFLKT